MKRSVLIVLLIIGGTAAASGDVQFRMAGSYATPFTVMPDPSLEQWTAIAMPNEQSLSGWHWEVVFSRMGLGMHYAVRFDEPGVYAPDWTVDWKGDFFLSYHLGDRHRPVDPFVEVGWGNAGRAGMTDYEGFEYPDWEEEIEDGDAVSLSFYRYVAAGVGLELGNVMVGGKLAYIAPEFVSPVPGSPVAVHRLAPFELSFFAGVALGGR
jgi:hypothetical protein